MSDRPPDLGELEQHLARAQLIGAQPQCTEDLTPPPGLGQCWSCDCWRKLTPEVGVKSTTGQDLGAVGTCHEGPAAANTPARWWCRRYQKADKKRAEDNLGDHLERLVDTHGEVYPPPPE